MTTLRQDMQAFGARLHEHTKALTAARALLLRRESAASLRRHPAAPAPAAMTAEEREERFRQECERRGVVYVPLPADQEADDR
jgi:hypothetical protein